MAQFMAVAPNIHCGGCAASIQRSLTKLPGVSAVEVEVESKRVTVEYDDSLQNPDGIAERLTQAGFPPEQE